MKQILLLFVVTIAATTAQFEFTFPEYRRTALGDSVDIASMKLLKEIYDKSPNKNVVTSPLGVLTLLSLYSSGSVGKIRDEVMQLLGSNDYRELTHSLTQLSQRFSAMDPSYMTLANKVLVSDKFTISNQFSRLAREYNSEVSSIDFGVPKNAADVINDWSSKKTKGMISKPVSESDIDASTAIALLNVIFFQGHWHVPFNASETKEKEFNIDRSNVVKVPMMHLQQSLFYYDDKDIGVQMVELPYKETKFRMIVVVPNDIDGLPEVLKKTSEKGLLENVFRMSPPGADLALDIPKFEVRSKIDLKNILPNVGVESIFKNGSPGIVKESNVVVSEAFQEAFVKVDEEGATAGAFTVTITTTMAFGGLLDYRSSDLGNSIDIASMKLLKEIYDKSSDKNVITSPLGLLILLSLYASGSEGKNREEIMQLLGANDMHGADNGLSDSYKQLTELYSTMNPSFLTLANKVLVSNKFTVNDEFAKKAREYHSDMSEIDFSDSKSAADVINDWSSRKTNGKISNPVSESDIDSATAIALLNVIFFQGHWFVPFNASETKEKEFNMARSTVVKLPMMHLEQSLNYMEDNDMGVRMIELPYQESKFRMIIVLPNEIDGLAEVLRKASEKGLHENIFEMSPARQVHLDLPKFEIKSKTNFKSILQKVGVSRIFSDGSSGVVKERSVVVSEVLQEAFVKIDEEGAMAGAFTGIFPVAPSAVFEPPPSIIFKVDRPFMFIILNDDITLFAGTYAGTNTK